MSLTNEHGKVAVAIIAMLTLSVLMIECKFSPQCQQVNRWTVFVLLMLIGAPLGLELDMLNRGGSR